MSFKSTKRIAIGALFAAVAGYIAGLLTAPKSGKETREDLAESAKLSKRELEKKLKEIHVELKKSIKEANNKLDSTKKELKKELHSAIMNAKKTEVKVKETLSALHEGTADNPELERAIKDANSALGHFKKFLK